LSELNFDLIELKAGYYLRLEPITEALNKGQNAFKGSRDQ